MNLKEVQELITSVADSGALEFKLNSEEVKIVVKGNKEDQEINLIHPIISGVGIVPQLGEVPKKAIHAKGTDREILDGKHNSENHTIKSPFIGTCLLQSSLGESRFIKVGDIINEGDVLCTIEALKLLNTVRSNVSGKITQILIEDLSPVEYDQSLFEIMPI